MFILRGSILPAILPRLLAVLIVSAGVVWLHHASPNHLRDVTAAPFTLLGLALSIFLGFRNNACYERWWEGRKQWGQLLAEARSLARELATLLPDDLSFEPFAIMLPRGDWAFRLAVNTGLAQVFRSGDVIGIYSKYFDSVAWRPSVWLGAVFAFGGLPE